MEENSLPSEKLNPAVNNTQKGISRNFTLLKKGVFEFFFAAVVLSLLLFGILNYFNILSISNVFPNQLSWLPRQTTPQKKLLYTPANPSPTPATAGFQYDTKKAETLLTQYLKDNIKPEFLPAKIEVKQHLISDNTLTGTDYEFGANWNLENIIFSANFHYLPNSPTQIRDMEFYINPPSSNISIDSANSALLTKTYLKNLPEVVGFDCGVFEKNTKFCEYFLEKKAGKSGFGTAEGNDEKGNKIMLIFSCFIPKNDSYYNKRTSCLLFREKDPSGL